MTTATGQMGLVFPGQGCQFVGMGADVCAAYPEARRVFEQADDTLGFSLSRLCFEGPQEELDETSNTQPAIYVATWALWQIVKARLEPLREHVALAAGHSLGEFTALTVAGALDFEDGVRLVRHRGEAMREAGAQAPGSMAAIIGLDDEVVRALVDEGSDGHGVWVANYNSPGQVVIAGEQPGVDRVLALARERGAKRALPLAVSVAAHTPLMQGAVERLATVLEQIRLRRPWIPVVSNATATAADDPQAIKEALLRQLSSPVRWVESIQWMGAQGVTSMLEVGPRSVVSGLIKRIVRDVALNSVTDVASVESLSVEAV
ncbi:MAG: ACP S-malonyltransferase [Chloroflexi bacterium]|jgi:[acyl-carrier-protein] S-malonyltransferase|nr:ACP S-malonyltransferase [Chloroflexota bacterium]